MNEYHDEAAKVIVKHYVEVEQEVVPNIDQKVEDGVPYLPANVTMLRNIRLILQFVFYVLLLVHWIFHVELKLEVLVIVQLFAAETFAQSLANQFETVLVLPDGETLLSQCISVVKNILRETLGKGIIDIGHKEQSHEGLGDHADLRLLRNLDNESSLRSEGSQNLHGTQKDVYISSPNIPFLPPLLLQKG